MTRKPLHGVALVKISTSPARVDNEFYAVFVHGEMRPIQWASWSAASAHFHAECSTADVKTREMA